MAETETYCTIGGDDFEEDREGGKGLIVCGRESQHVPKPKTTGRGQAYVVVIVFDVFSLCNADNEESHKDVPDIERELFPQMHTDV